MRYDESSGEILITSGELVTIARRSLSGNYSREENEPSYSASSLIPLNYSFELGESTFTLMASVSSCEGNSIYLSFPVDSSPKRPRREEIKEARGEAFIAGYILSKIEGYKDIYINITYISHATGEENTISENVKVSALEVFFNKCKKAVKDYAYPEIDRVKNRLPSMKRVKFPYDNVREGQREIMQRVYKNVARGGTLFTSAPTGTGKTVSILYPAIKAYGEGRCEKIFYLTPKTTTARSAEDCIKRLSSSGAIIRAVTLPSKERACVRGVLCRSRDKDCVVSISEGVSLGALKLFSDNTPTVSLERIREVAKEYNVCPYELALTYSELCDIVICDINYLFNNDVYIRRYFTNGGDYAFLIDEAHNLGDRAREMYSSDISVSDLEGIGNNEIFPQDSPIHLLSREAGATLYDILFPYIKEEIYRDRDEIVHGASHLSEIPASLYELFDSLPPRLEDLIYKEHSSRDEEKEERLNALKEYYYRVRAFARTLEEFDTGYELFVFLDGEELRCRIFCIDPSKPISKRLALGKSATFFSGTLSPMYYYRALLGGDNSAGMVEVDSPFDNSQLSVSIMDKISTRHSERVRTLPAVIRTIAATVSAKRGKYMIFSPSFEYSELIYNAFIKKYPKIHAILQRKDMASQEKRKFLSLFEEKSDNYLIGFCVMGGIYSEGIDLVGDELIGAVIVGIGIPSLSYEREAIKAYYNDKYEEGVQFAYVYPGVNRVLQAAGRVIRREDDRGVIVLIDDRFDDPIYKTVIPKLWSNMQFIEDAKELREELDKFWGEK